MQNGDCNYLILEMTLKPGSDADLQAASEPICPLVTTMRPAK
jgi:hypothetical protein